MTDVFVSYSRRDSAFVLGLANELRERGKEVWLDTDGLADGEVFPQALRSAIEGADAFVLVISPDSAESRYCTVEVDHAAQLGKRIVPVLLRPVADEALPAEIRERNWIPADAPDAAARVVSAVETDLEHVRAHTRWTTRAVEWGQAGRDRSLLPRGSELAAGESWLAGCGPDADPAPTALQRELVLSGRRAQSRRQRRLLGVATAALVVSLALLVVAVIARHTADRQRQIAQTQRVTADSRALAARGDAAISLSPLAALHLARSAVLVQANDDSLRALKSAEDAQSLIAAPASVGAHHECYDQQPVYRPRSPELALGSCDGTVHIVDAHTGISVRTLRFGEGSGAVAYRPDGDELAVAAETSLRLVSPVSGLARAVVRLPQPGDAIIYSPDGRRVAVTTATRVVLIDDRTHRLRTLLQQPEPPGGVGFVQDGREVVVATRNSVAVFSTRSGREIRRLRTPRLEPGSLAVSPDGNQIAVAVNEPDSSYVELWSSHSWRLERMRPRVGGDNIDALAYSVDGTRLVVGTVEDAVEVIPTSGGRPTFAARMSDDVTGVAAGPGGEVAAIASSGEARIWRTVGVAQDVIGPFPDVQDVSQSGHTLQIVSAGPSGSGAAVHFYTPDGRSAPRPFTVASFGARVDDLGDDGRLLIDARQAVRARATVWDIHHRRVIGRLPALNIAWDSFYGRRVLLGIDSPEPGASQFASLRVYDPRTKRLEPPMYPAGHTCLGVGAWLSADGTRAVMADQCRNLAVYDPRSGRLLRKTKLPAAAPNGAIALSPDGHLIAVFYADGQGEIRNADTLDVRANLVGHVGYVFPIGFAHTDRWLVTVGTDHTMRVWRTSTGSPVRTLETPEALVYGVLLPDDRIAAVSEVSRTYVYDLCNGCGQASTLLGLSAPEMRLPLTAIDRAIIRDH